MINVVDKKDCVGCNACGQRCPVSCISMREDEQGFLYPVVDIAKCINCGLCERVCPVLNQAEPRIPDSVLGARNKDTEIVKNSSSGGLFYALAQMVIEDGGVVFGARFNERWQVVHDWTDTIDGLKRFQGSKYVQSQIGTAYRQAEKFLKEGRTVMFTGTPCQIKGLSLFLQKDYGPRLIKVDIVCHGAPSPTVWREYVKHIAETNRKTIRSISFRDKRHGWKDYGFKVTFASPVNITEKENEFFELQSKNLYMRTFLSNLDLRPSCYKCPAKCGKSGANITLADFWGITRVNPEFYSPDGVSLILNFDGSPIRRLNDDRIETIAVSYEDAVRYNPSIEQDPLPTPYVDPFWSEFHQKGIAALDYVKTINRQSFGRRLVNKIKSLALRIVRPVIRF